MNQSRNKSGGNKPGGNQTRREFPLTATVVHTVLATRSHDKEATVLIRVSLKRGKLGAHEVTMKKYAVYSTLWNTDGENNFFEIIPKVIRTSNSHGEINFPVIVNLDDPTIIRCFCFDNKTGKELIIESDAFTVKTEEETNKEVARINLTAGQLQGTNIVHVNGNSSRSSVFIEVLVKENDGEVPVRVDLQIYSNECGLSIMTGKTFSPMKNRHSIKVAKKGSSIQIQTSHRRQEVFFKSGNIIKSLTFVKPIS